MPETDNKTNGRRWRRMPEQRPQQILDAALVVFGEEGFEHARLEDVAERAHVSKGTIYNYFPSKEALFEEMVRHALSGLLESAERAARSESDARSALVGLITEFWTYLRSPVFETVYRLVMAELTRFPQLARFYTRELRDRVIGLSANILRRGMREGAFRHMDVDAASRMLLALLVKHGMWCSRRETWPDLAERTDEEVLSEILDFYLYALSPAAAGARVVK